MPSYSSVNKRFTVGGVLDLEKMLLSIITVRGKKGVAPVELALYEAMTGEGRYEIKDALFNLTRSKKIEPKTDSKVSYVITEKGKKDLPNKETLISIYREACDLAEQIKNNRRAERGTPLKKIKKNTQKKMVEKVAKKPIQTPKKTTKKPVAKKEETKKKATKKKTVPKKTVTKKKVTKNPAVKKAVATKKSGAAKKPVKKAPAVVEPKPGSNKAKIWKWLDTKNKVRKNPPSCKDAKAALGGTFTASTINVYFSQWKKARGVR